MDLKRTFLSSRQVLLELVRNESVMIEYNLEHELRCNEKTIMSPNLNRGGARWLSN